MTILRTIAPYPGGGSLRLGMRDLRASIEAARRGFGEGRPPFAALRDGGGTALVLLDLGFPMNGHPRGYELLDVSIGVDPQDDLARRLLQPGRAGEGLLLVEQALTGAVDHPQQSDHADLVAEGLAWSLLEGRPEIKVVIHRPTP